MRVQLVYQLNRKVIAAMDGDACPVLDGLRNVDASMKASAQGMDVLFRRYSDQGRAALTAALFHEVDKEDGIWEFIKGRLRVLCFVSPEDGSVLVLSHYFVKKAQKTPKSEISKAVGVKKAYRAALAVKDVEEIEVDVNAAEDGGDIEED